MNSSADAPFAAIVAEMTNLLHRARALGRQEESQRVIALLAANLAPAAVQPEPLASRVEVAQASSGRVAPGAIKNAIRGIVAAAGAAGIAEADVAARLPADTKRSSRYMAIRSLEEAGEIARRDGRLFPATKAEEPGAGAPGGPTDLL
ncbi:MAG: hypothetical protein O9325_03920 [Roseomonas sp.]|nr:hypothetical protein [Roseomonas sp.]